jgi:hypothetical protein
MRAHFVVALLWLASAALGGEPDRAKGLSAHMLPDRVAQIDGRNGGFTVGSETYPDAAKLVAHFRTLSPAAQENGVWVVTTHPSAYSLAEHEKLRALVTLCQQQKIPIFTCRGSELPGGWKRSALPTGWDAPGDAQ